MPETVSMSQFSRFSRPPFSPRGRADAQLAGNCESRMEMSSLDQARCGSGSSGFGASKFDRARIKK